MVAGPPICAFNGSTPNPCVRAGFPPFIDGPDSRQFRSVHPEHRCRMNPTVDKENRQETQPLYYVIPSVAEESQNPEMESRAGI